MSSRPLPVDSDPSDASWHELEDLLDQIARVSKSDITAGAFYRLLLDRIVPAIGAAGGAIWISRGHSDLRLEYQIDLAAGAKPLTRDLLSRHQTLVEQLLAGQPRILPPRSGESPDDPTANPTDCWLTFYPFEVGPESRGVIELVESRAMSAADSRRNLELLAAVVELADDFHRNHDLGVLREREQSWRQFDQFALRVHGSLDLDETAFLIANEARRVLDCDRVNVLVRSGDKYRATAISGVDVLDRRAKIVHALEQLATRTAAAGDPLWYHDGAEDLPDELQRPLQTYLDEGHARLVAVVPLRTAEHEKNSHDKGRRAPIDAILVAEQFHADVAEPVLRERMAAIEGHCQSALANSLAHSRQPLAAVGRKLGRMRVVTEARNLPKTVLALAGATAVVAALALIPADFDIEARGELEPARRRDVFASDDGVVSQLQVDHGQAVKADEPLVVLRKPELDLEFRRIAGEIQTAEKKLAAIQAERLENAPVAPEQKRNVHQLTADEEELKELLKGLRQQHEILELQQRELTVRSPIDGQALTWNLKELLEARPVQRGQTLVSVADLDGPWVAELHLPDHRSGHVLAAREELEQDLDVSFALTADPGEVYEGRITKMALSTEQDEEAGGPTVLVTVDFDRSQVAGLHPGATVIARIHCGRRAIGYVWLHDLFEAIQSHWWW